MDSTPLHSIQSVCHPWGRVCCAGAFCDWGYYCASPIFKDLGSLEGNVKHLDTYTGNVGVKGFEDLREKPIRAIQDVAG